MHQKFSQFRAFVVIGRLMSTIRFSTLAGQLCSAADKIASNKQTLSAGTSCIWPGRLQGHV